MKTEQATYSKNRLQPRKRNNRYKKTISYTAAEVLAEERTAFIRKTYLHLAGAIALFVLLEAFLLSTEIPQNIYYSINSIWSVLLIIAVLLISYLVSKELAKSNSSKTQYFGFGLSIFTEALIFAPLLFFIRNKAGVEILQEAAVATIGLFLGITAIVFLTRENFSFLTPILIISGFLLLGFIAAGITFGYWIRSFFVFAMVAFSGSWVLLNTSNMLHRYKTNQYVAASISLFFSILTLFWAVLRVYSYSSKIVNQNQDSRT